LAATLWVNLGFGFLLSGLPAWVEPFSGLLQIPFAVLSFKLAMRYAMRLDRQSDDIDSATDADPPRKSFSN